MSEPERMFLVNIRFASFEVQLKKTQVPAFQNYTTNKYCTITNIPIVNQFIVFFMAQHDAYKFNKHMLLTGESPLRQQHHNATIPSQG